MLIILPIIIIMIIIMIVIAIFSIYINQQYDYRSYCFFDVMLLPTTAQSIGDSLRRLRQHLCSSAMSY